MGRLAFHALRWSESLLAAGARQIPETRPGNKAPRADAAPSNANDNATEIDEALAESTSRSREEKIDIRTRGRSGIGCILK
jgi:hypothetical protein